MGGREIKIALEHRPLRSEIQGLRAIAVTAVLCFHIWPLLLPGGYIGVDVFFVISGYLITGLLFREARQGTLSLAAFYARRARRLLPAATLVLLVVASATPLLPETQWDETSLQIMASSVFVENWMLAGRAMDYLGSQDPASPVQHFWSLSVEEQFYFVWPVIILAVVVIGKRLHWPLRFTLIVSLGAIFGASLSCSLLLTATDPASAYFATYTRVWEFGLGGLLVLGEGRWLFPERLRAIAGLAGLSAIIAAAVLFSASTPFPGAAALLPTLGAALVIFAADAGGISAHTLLKPWPLQYLGDRSYSIYLWHWPILIFAGVLLDRNLTLIDGLMLIIVTTVVAHVSFALVEAPFWRGSFKKSAVVKPLGLAFAAIIACVVPAAIIIHPIAAGSEPPRMEANYPGPSALLGHVKVPSGVEPIPPLRLVKKDKPMVYGTCHQNEMSSAPLSCTFGAPKAWLHIVVVGDSHAAQWIPTLQALAEKNGWKVTTFTKSACPFARASVLSNNAVHTSCADWRESVLDAIRTIHPDLVLTSQYRGYTLAPEPGGKNASMVDGLKQVWGILIEQGISVIAIRDTPIMPMDPTKCLAQKHTDCAVLRRDALQVDDPIMAAAERMPSVRLVDLTSTICGEEFCEPLVGNIIVWRDETHLTATYAAALRDQFELIARLPAPSSQWADATKAPWENLFFSIR